jgi:transcriptional regulator with XRE-family HTH domain
MDHALKNTIANNLKNLRLSQDMSQEAFAKKCGMMQRAYGRLENAENWQHLESLERIALANGLNVWQLLLPNIDITNPPKFRQVVS